MKTMGRIALASVLGAALCLLSGCGGCQGDKGKAGEGLSTLPAGATMVVAIDLPALMGDKGLSAFETLMKQQLGDTLKPVTAAGLELSALEQIILWKDEGADNPAVIVLGKFDAKKAVEGLAALGGGPQVLGDNGLLLAPPKVAAKIIAAREGKAPQLDMTKAPGAYLKKVGTNGGLVFAIAEKHEHFAGRLSLAGDIEIAVYGSQIPAEMVSQAKEQLGMVKLSAGMLSPELVMQQFPAEIVGGLQGMDLERIIAIGKELIEQTELDVIDATSILATTSASDGDYVREALFSNVMSMVALPAFMKYQSRAKTSEAVDSLDKLYKGVSVYYSSPRVDASGKPVSCQLPSSAGPTPAPIKGKHPCCVNPTGQCSADPGLWDKEPWSSLMFQLNESHYFMYEIKTKGSGASAKTTLSAYGDLDCDGTFSTFSRTLHPDPANKGSDCYLQPNGRFYIEAELE